MSSIAERYSEAFADAARERNAVEALEADAQAILGLLADSEELRAFIENPFTWLYRLAGGFARRVVPWLPRFLVYNPLNAWGKQRELPPFPKQSFRQLYKARQGKR